MSLQTKKICEVQSNQDINFEFFGTNIGIPYSPALNTAILVTILGIKITEFFKSKPVEFAIDLLRGTDLDLLERLDEIAAELKELTKADRVLIAGFHNGKKNHKYHWKRMSVLAESCRLGIESVAHKLKDVDTFSVLAKSDYDYLLKLKAEQIFVHTHLDLPTVSLKQKRFLSTCYMFGQYVYLLVDGVSPDPHSVIFIQYDSREKCEVETEKEVGWSEVTREMACQKALVINSLIYDRGTSNLVKIVDTVKRKLRIF